VNAVLWDMDDTLLNTLPVRVRALSHAFEICLGRRVADPLAVFREHHGQTLESLSANVMDGDGRAFAEAYRDYCANDLRVREPFPGVPEALAALHEAGIPMAVVTSKIAHGAIDELERAGILRYFGAVVCFDDTDAHKPEPDPLHLAMDRLFIDDPSAVIYVGDSPADMQAAHYAGCTAVAALWGTLDSDGLLDALPDVIAQSPAQVLQLAVQPAGSVR
jgi:pyrophosphatase PpaX